ncbi:protein kinase domain protein, partial [Ichthyophthirius multifiliis]
MNIQTQPQSQELEQNFIRIIPHEKMKNATRKEIGQGTFGSVYKIAFENQNYALKICKLQANDAYVIQKFNQVFSEAETMQKFMLIQNSRIMPLKGISFEVDISRKSVNIGYWIPL